MIKALDVRKSFGLNLAVDGVSFEVNRGEVLGFLGPNGAGKSTTMRMLTGFLPLSGGQILVGDCDIEDDPVGVKRQIGYLPENAPAYGDMTVSAFLSFVAGIRGFEGQKRKDVVEKAIETCYLNRVRNQVIETLSKGYRHRVGFAQSIIHDPPVLVLDEPTDGLDPNQKHEMRQLIKEMGKTKAIIVSTHILEEVEAICSRVIIIDRGKLVFNGTPDELQNKSDDAGRVMVRLLNVNGDAVMKQLDGHSEIKKVTVEVDEPRNLRIVFFPAKHDEQLAQHLKKMFDQNGWQFDELHTEPGQLNEVFRNITSPDSVKEVEK
ncbi:MAG: ATP-binding cassette domain-containing protein [Victivallaceae bacterium]|nr:ATP-binding cassette domain-containing protein [Victivallaceae bacterium]